MSLATQDIPRIGTLTHIGRSIATPAPQGNQPGAVGQLPTTSQEFDKFIELVPDGILGSDAGGKIVFANTRAAQLFGYSRAELLGLEIDRLIPERFHRNHEQERQASFGDLRTRPMHTAEGLVARRADGSEFPADISLMWLKTEQGHIATTAIRDISDRAAAQDQHQQLESELALNQARRLESVGQLAGGVAHDFNNQLAVILNYSRFVRDSLADQPELQADLDSIVRAAERAADLTNQLLVFSQRDVIKPEPTDANELVRELCETIERDLAPNTELNIDLADDLWAINADRDHLRRAILELTENARHALPDGGVIGIETANVELDEIYVEAHPDVSHAGRYVRIAVTDDGAGMSAEVRERAFEPFFSTKDKAIGNGLGLATVYGSIRQVGGNVFLYSEEGRGTSVKLHLPAVDVAAGSLTTAEANEQLHRARGVLVVEDEDAVRRLVDRMLADRGYEVTLSASGTEAIELLSDPENIYDVMLTDMVMPEMQGTELADRARALRPDLRIVFMSGYSESVIAKQLAGDEPIDLLEKPFTMEALLNKIGAATGRDVSASE